MRQGSLQRLSTGVHRMNIIANVGVGVLGIWAIYCFVLCFLCLGSPLHGLCEVHVCTLLHIIAVYSVQWWLWGHVGSPGKYTPSVTTKRTHHIGIQASLTIGQSLTYILQHAPSIRPICSLHIVFNVQCYCHRNLVPISALARGTSASTNRQTEGVSCSSSIQYCFPTGSKKQPLQSLLRYSAGFHAAGGNIPTDNQGSHLHRQPNKKPFWQRLHLAGSSWKQSGDLVMPIRQNFMEALSSTPVCLPC